MPAVNNQPITLDAFYKAACTARATGGALDVNRNGALVVKGKQWHGRAALWLKEQIFPNTHAARNERILNAFGESLRIHWAVSNPVYRGKKFALTAAAKKNIRLFSNQGMNRKIISNIHEARSKPNGL